MRLKHQSAHRRKNGKLCPMGPEFGYGTIAEFNRHTHRPHENLREIGRRMSKPGTDLRREYMRDAQSAR